MPYATCYAREACEPSEALSHALYTHIEQRPAIRIPEACESSESVEHAVCIKIEVAEVATEES
jgi:hypothetical protein